MEKMYYMEIKRIKINNYSEFRNKLIEIRDSIDMILNHNLKNSDRYLNDLNNVTELIERTNELSYKIYNLKKLNIKLISSNGTELTLS